MTSSQPATKRAKGLVLGFYAVSALLLVGFMAALPMLLEPRPGEEFVCGTPTFAAMSLPLGGVFLSSFLGVDVLTRGRLGTTARNLLILVGGGFVAIVTVIGGTLLGRGIL